MKNRMILAASIALAFTTSAFAQDNAQPMPASQADDQMAPADSQPMAADAQPMATTTPRRMSIIGHPGSTTPIWQPIWAHIWP